jgi:hypothetical protein
VLARTFLASKAVPTLVREITRPTQNPVSSLGWNKGALAPPCVPLGSPLVQETNGMAPLRGRDRSHWGHGSPSHPPGRAHFAVRA